MRDQHVLLHREADFGLPVDARQTAQLDQIVARNPSDGDEHPHRGQPAAALLGHAEVVAAVERGRVLAGAGQVAPQFGLDGGAEALDAPLAQQHLEPRLLAALARAVVAEHGEHRAGQVDHILGRGEGVERDRQERLFAAHRAADQRVEADRAVAPRRREGEVVRLRERAVVGAAGDAEVELARQIAEAAPPDDHLLEAAGQRRGVDQFLAVNAGERAADDVAHVVHARLLRGEVDRAEPLQHARRVLDADPAQLDVLAGGEVRLAAPELVGDVADRRQLLGGQQPVGDAHAQHEEAGRGLAVEQAVPLEPLDVAVLVDGLFHLRVAVQVGQDIQPVLGLLVQLDPVGHGGSPSGSRLRRRARQG